MTQTSEKAFETVIESHLMANGYVAVGHIARETTKLDALRLAAERTIGLLKERRAALIAAAVSGKIATCQGTGKCNEGVRSC